MKGRAAKDITGPLQAWSQGDPQAAEEALELVYTELRRLAARRLRGERRGHTLDATGLVHEVYLRLSDQRRVAWRNRSHFFGFASELMRRILVDHARRRRSAKRGGTWCRVPLDEEGMAAAERRIDVAALDAALTRLAVVDPRQARAIELRFFGGLSIEETAEALDSSPATVKREWDLAKAWLYRQLRKARP